MTARDSIHRHRTRFPYAAALVALSALGACTSSGATGTPTASSRATSAVTTTATPSATTSSATSPTTSVDPVIAKIPAEARAITEAGAQAFARFFIESLSRGATTPDQAALAGLFTPSCKTCSAMDASLQELKSQGERHSAASISVTRTSPLAVSPLSAQVLIDVQQNRVKVVNAKGATLRETASGPGTFVMTMSVQGGHWVATKLQTA